MRDLWLNLAESHQIRHYHQARNVMIPAKFERGLDGMIQGWNAGVTLIPAVR